MSQPSKDIWQKLSQKLPQLSEEQRKQAQEQWLLNQLRQDRASVEEEEQAVMKAIFDDNFYEEVQKEKPYIKPSAKRISLYSWQRVASAIAAMFLLAWGLVWMADERHIYAEALAMGHQPIDTGVSYLGGTYELYSDLCRLQEGLPVLAQDQKGVAIPEQVAIVSQVGEQRGVAFFEVSGGNCSIRVLTKEQLPQVGEMVSFNGKAVALHHFGREIVLLIETTRHEVF